MKKARVVSFLMSAVLAFSFIPAGIAGAQAQTPGVTIQQVEDLGSTSLVTASSVPNIGNEAALPQALNLQLKKEFEFPHVAGASPLLSAPLVPASAPVVPAVKGSPVTTNHNDASGFNALSHLDQRLAGTGAYTNTQFSLEPPDQGLCVGGDYVVEAINTALAVYDKSGNLLAGPTALNQFFNLVPEINRTTGVRGDFTSDPKCYYDTMTRRFFLTLLQIDPGLSIRSHTLIAVSATSNPTGSWRFFRFDTTDDGLFGTPSHPGCATVGCFGDQPLIGADAYGFYITTNEFSNDGAAFNMAQVYALSKSALAAGLVPPAMVHFDNIPLAEGYSYTLQPATSPSASQYELDRGGTEYLLSALDFNGALDNRVALWALTNTRSLNRSSPNVSLASQVLASESYGQPGPAHQKAGPQPYGGTALLPQLNSNDDRMNQVVYAGGLLYSGVNTILTVGGVQQVGIAYFEVKPGWKKDALNGKVDQQGYVAVKGNDVIFPSIGVTSEGKALMAFTLTGADYYPSAAYLKLSEDRTPVHLIGVGAGPEDGFTGYNADGSQGTARWGDYSAAVASGGSIWFATEYIPGGPRTLFANWGTFIGSLNP